MSQIDTLRATASAPLYEIIDLGAYHESLRGKTVRVRVNLSRRVARALTAARASNDVDEYLRLTAALIPRDVDGDMTPLTLEEFKQFLAGSDEDDPVFGTWLIGEIWERVTDHFLVRANGSARKSAHGADQSIEPAAP